MSQPEKTDIDKLIDALEEMIDARDDMWQEEKFCNYRHLEDIRQKRYYPAKEDIRFYLKKVIYKYAKDIG
jgi:hypothetical protein